MAQYGGIWTLTQSSQAVAKQNWTGISPPVVEYLIVAGGGGATAGGGGAGGLLQGYAGITVGSSYFVTVGAGGPGNDVNTGSGNNSVFDSTSSGASTGRIVALGGGQGSGAGNYSMNVSGGAFSGGSGGGSWQTGTPGLGTSGQGNSGGNSGSSGGTSTAGGGGGAGTIGLNSTANYVGANGGAGIASAISGTITTYAGGGAGGGYQSVGVGGVGGGGSAGVAGIANTGGGGGGYHQDPAPSVNGAAGGSGIVIIRYPSKYKLAANVVTGTYSTCSASAYNIYTFLSSGSITF